jgi:hypothetical protein
MNLTLDRTWPFAGAMGQRVGAHNPDQLSFRKRHYRFQCIDVKSSYANSHFTPYWGCVANFSEGGW